MKLSIVVPAFNEEQLLAATLACVQAGREILAASGWSSELIVCDNNSTDRTAQIAAAEGARVVFERVNQISRARNAGAAAAVGEWLLFVDADSLPDAGLFEDLARAMADASCMAGGSTLRFPADAGLGRLPVWFWNRLSRFQGWAAGAFVFCRAPAFREAGGFSLALYAAEEIDLFRRLKRLARSRGQRIEILHRHPLLTSARKLRLYSAREAFGFLLRTVLGGGRTLHRAADCHIWYDGRR
jgi:glycosyltransferase involved in cell wall biosynthesis